MVTRNLDEQLALFVNWTGIFAFFLILLQHLVSVLGNREPSSTSTKSNKDKDKKNRGPNKDN